MGSASLNASALSFVFNVTAVKITSNATVKAGQLLGLEISGSDFAPYCHLEYATDAASSFKLYQQGVGQNSWRGLSGRTSPVYQRIGQSVKLFASYAY